MTNVERLKFIKRKCRYAASERGEYSVMATSDIEWLIGQAERVQELDSQCNNLQTLNDQLIFSHIEPLEVENKRLREALKEIADGCGPPDIFAKHTLEELEGAE